MSNRTLIEINHDYCYQIEQGGALFLSLLRQYLRSGDKQRMNEHLERFGVRVITMRHHSEPFYIEEGTDGFPANYVSKDWKPEGFIVPPGMGEEGGA